VIVSAWDASEMLVAAIVASSTGAERRFEEFMIRFMVRCLRSWGLELLTTVPPLSGRDQPRVAIMARE
jgi:hypothetical protein